MPQFVRFEGPDGNTSDIGPFDRFILRGIALYGCVDGREIAVASQTYTEDWILSAYIGLHFRLDPELGRRDYDDIVMLVRTDTPKMIPEPPRNQPMDWMRAKLAEFDATPDTPTSPPEKTATFIRKLDRQDSWIDARLYRLSVPMEVERAQEDDQGDYVVRLVSSDYVVVSGSSNPCLRWPETYIFLADEQGEITDWSECPGSFQGHIDHEEALKNAGYTLIS